MKNGDNENTYNDEVLAEMLKVAVLEMAADDDPFVWFENRGISRDAAMQLAEIVAEAATKVESGALTGFVAGWSLHEGLTEKGFI